MKSPHRVIVSAAVAWMASTAFPQSVIDIGERLQVLWDDHIVETTHTTAERIVHHPEYDGTVLIHDRPWEGDGCIYHCFVPDRDGKGDLLRLYYTAGAIPIASKDVRERFSADGFRACYAESRDGGRTWVKPELGIVEFRGSKKNNCIADKSSFGWDVENFFVFKDTRPGCPASERYKAVCQSGYEPVPDDWPALVPEQVGAQPWKVSVIGGKRHERNLWCMVSADGIRFRRGWLMTRLGAFDSLNVAFWDAVRGEYHLYFRAFHGMKPGVIGIRDVRHSVSKDFRTWSAPERIGLVGVAEDFALYTNVIQPYFREPSVFVGFPSRYVERTAWAANYDRLPAPEKRRWRMAREHGGEPRLGTAVTDCVFIFSRDGRRFFLEDDAFMTPGPENRDNWVYGDCYPAYPLLTAKSPLGGDDEIVIYAKSGHWSGLPSRLNRYRLRMDGFISRRAPYAGARTVTRPLVFSGSEMRVNFSTSARGWVRVTVRDIETGARLRSVELFGDKVDRVVDFHEGKVSAFAGKPVALEFDMADADIYSFRFGKGGALP